LKILFTICGRAGSKGIKNKNLREFCGSPLPFYALSAIDLYAQRHPEHDCETVVSSDSETLLNLFEKNPVREVSLIRRAQDLSGDVIAKWFVIRDCLVRMKDRRGADYELVVDLDITSPLRTVADMESLMREMSGGDYDAVFSVAESRRNPYFNMVKPGADGGYERVIPSGFTARQQAPEIFDINGSLYAYRPDFLLRAGGIFEGRCGVIKMFDPGILDLDRENDFELMTVVADWLYRTNAAFGEVKDHIRDAASTD